MIPNSALAQCVLMSAGSGRATHNIFVWSALRATNG